VFECVPLVGQKLIEGERTMSRQLSWRIAEQSARFHLLGRFFVKRLKVDSLPH
jgi:hypothetical protein